MFRGRGFIRLLFLGLLIIGLMSLGGYFGWSQGFASGLAAADGADGIARAYPVYPYYGFGFFPFFFLGGIFKLFFFIFFFGFLFKMFGFWRWRMAGGPEHWKHHHGGPPWRKGHHRGDWSEEKQEVEDNPDVASDDPDKDKVS